MAEVDQISMTPVEVLAKALEIWGPNGEHWIKGTLGDGKGSYCAIGGLFVAGGGVLRGSTPVMMPTEANNHAVTAACGLIKKRAFIESIGLWNDSRSSFAEVKQVCCDIIKDELAKDQSKCSNSSE